MAKTSMVKVRYVGPHDEVELYVPIFNEPRGSESTWQQATVKNGELLEVTANYAEALLEQPANWLPADKKPPKKED